MNLPVSRNPGPTYKKVRYLDESADLCPVEVPLTHRDWVVTDLKASTAAAEAELGEPIDEWWIKHAQWFICEENNTAALAIYRRKSDADQLSG